MKTAVRANRLGAFVSYAKYYLLFISRFVFVFFFFFHGEIRLTLYNLKYLDMVSDRKRPDSLVSVVGVR